jgi:hypothetical protein
MVLVCLLKKGGKHIQKFSLIPDRKMPLGGAVDGILMLK